MSLASLRNCCVAASCLSFVLSIAAADDLDQLKVGVQPDGRIVVPTNQILQPAGKQVLFPGRPVDLAFADDGKTLVVKNMRSLVFVDAATGKIKQTLALPQKGKDKLGFSVVGLVVAGEKVYATDAKEHIRIAEALQNGAYYWRPGIELAKPTVGGMPNPAGIALASPEKLWVAVTRANSVRLLNRETGQVEQEAPVGVAPYALLSPRPGRWYVSNWGGDPPKPGDPQALSSGTPVR